MNKNISGIILAGGQSRRLGRDKAFLKIGQQTVLDILIKKLLPLCPEIIISVKSPDKFSRHIAKHYPGNNNIKLICDVLPERSSLSGIYSALKNLNHKYGLVIACDMPLVQTKLMELMIKQRKDFDVVVPETLQGLEPLCAIYSRKCLKYIEQLIKQNNYKIIDFFPLVKVKTIHIPASNRPKNNGFININTIEDLKKINKILGTKCQN